LVEAREILSLIEHLAPSGLAESWDNVGLMVGSGREKVKKAALSLDPTLENIQAAHEIGAQLLLTHHPLIFTPLTKINPDEPSAAAVALALELGITVISAHTNLDAAENGVSWSLARRFGLKEVTVLQSSTLSTQTKLVVFVPLGYETRVRQALFQAGAGRIGEYTGCSFAVKGEGTFIPSEHADPFMGQAGRTSRVSESRLEVLVETRFLEKVITAMKNAHPYEEAAFDIYPLADPVGRYGIGCIGRLDKALDIGGLTELVKVKLDVNTLRVAASTPDMIEVVAVVGGSGGDYVSVAKARGAQVLISGDFSYHHARDAEVIGLALIDAGHFATEIPGLWDLADRLSQSAEKLGLDVEFEILTREKDPWSILGQR